MVYIQWVNNLVLRLKQHCPRSKSEKPRGRERVRAPPSGLDNELAMATTAVLTARAATAAAVLPAAYSASSDRVLDLSMDLVGTSNFSVRAPGLTFSFIVLRDEGPPTIYGWMPPIRVRSRSPARLLDRVG